MNISYSALDVFTKCPFSFKLKYVDKVPYDRGSIHTAFGSAVHKAIQLKLLDNSSDLEKSFKDAFKEELKNLPEKNKNKILNEDKKLAEDMVAKGANLCALALEHLNKTFPEFKLVDVEKVFIEPIVEYQQNDYEMKGIIDLIIQTTDGRYHIIDWKTCSWGWDAQKKNNKMTTYQLTYYKHYFCLQNNIDVNLVDTHFALIKRTAKKDNIEIFDVPVGQKKIGNALKVLSNMVHNVDHKNFPKNRLSCQYCEFYKSNWCP